LDCENPIPSRLTNHPRIQTIVKEGGLTKEQRRIIKEYELRQNIIKKRHLCNKHKKDLLGMDHR